MLPNKWGQGQLFAFSALDGEPSTGSKNHLPLLCKHIVTGGVGCFREMLFCWVLRYLFKIIVI